MAHVTVTIDGKQFRMACEDGQEAHLESLAQHIDGRIKMMRESFGEIGDLRLTMMAALMVCDELFEERRKGVELRACVEADKSARVQVAESVSQRDLAIAHAIDGVTQRVDRITRMLAAPHGEG
jgi:cell division protein ZapA